MPYDSDDQETVEISGEIKAVTKVAVLIDSEFGERWVPKSLMSGCAADDLWPAAGFVDCQLS